MTRATTVTIILLANLLIANIIIILYIIIYVPETSLERHKQGSNDLLFEAVEILLASSSLVLSCCTLPLVSYTPGEMERSHCYR